MSNELVKLPKGLPAEVRESLLKHAEKTATEMVANTNFVPVQISSGDVDDGLKLKCVVLGYRKANGFWIGKKQISPIDIKLDPDRNDTLPICWAVQNGIMMGSRNVPETFTSFENKTVTCFGECGTEKNPICWLNSYDSASSGKACSNTRRVIILFENEELPKILKVTAASLKRWDAYSCDMISKKIPCFIHWTEIEFERITEGSMKYSRIKSIAIGDPIDSETGIRVSEMLNTYAEEILGASEDTLSAEPEDHTGGDTDTPY